MNENNPDYDQDGRYIGEGGGAGRAPSPPPPEDPTQVRGRLQRERADLFMGQPGLHRTQAKAIAKLPMELRRLVDAYNTPPPSLSGLLTDQRRSLRSNQYYFGTPSSTIKPSFARADQMEADAQSHNFGAFAATRARDETRFTNNMARRLDRGDLNRRYPGNLEMDPAFLAARSQVRNPRAGRLAAQNIDANELGRRIQRALADAEEND